MGYTHYFQLHQKPTDEEWDNFDADVSKILDGNAVPLDNESTPYRIFLNGVDEDSHETFVLDRDSTRWNFCKTARKPYDDVVSAILIAARYNFGDKFSLSSDGTWEDWQAGCNLIKRTLGYYAEESEVFGNTDHDFR